jgi:hypothetical protein
MSDITRTFFLLYNSLHHWLSVSALARARPFAKLPFMRRVFGFASFAQVSVASVDSGFVFCSV